MIYCSAHGRIRNAIGLLEHLCKGLKKSSKYHEEVMKIPETEGAPATARSASARPHCCNASAIGPSGKAGRKHRVPMSKIDPSRMDSNIAEALCTLPPVV